MKEDDLILAFFPCTRFEAQIILGFRGDLYQEQKWTEQQRLAYDLKLHRELSANYELITKLTMLVLRKNLRMVFENPYSEQHYLTRYWCMKPQIIDYDRRLEGDIFKKPTQYYFINFEPKNNILFEPIDYVETKKVSDMVCFNSKTNAKFRSEIHPQYASRFIRRYLIDYEQDFKELYK